MRHWVRRCAAVACVVVGLCVGVARGDGVYNPPAEVEGTVHADDDWTSTIMGLAASTLTNYAIQGWIAATNWTASTARTITSGMLSNWNAAYSAGTNWYASAAYKLSWSGSNVVYQVGIGTNVPLANASDVASSDSALQSQITGHGTTLGDHRTWIDRNRDDISLNLLRIHALQDSAALGAQWRLSDYYEDLSGIGGGSNYVHYTNGAYVSWDYATVAAPALHYPLNDNAANSNVVDTSGNDRHGTLVSGNVVPVNTEDFSTTGQITNAITVGGGSSCVDLGATVSGIWNGWTQWTVCVWVNGLAANQNATISKLVVSSKNTDPNYDRWYIDWQTSGTIFGAVWRKPGGDQRLKFYYDWPYLDGTWHHYAVVYNVSGMDISVYVDGVLIEPTTTIIAGSDIVAATDQRVQVGGNYRYGLTGNTQYNFVGDLDDFRVFEGVLTPAQIAAIHNEGTGTEANALEAGGNMLLQSTNTFYAAANLVTNRLLLLIEDDDDLVPGTDVLADVSNNGSTWAPVAIADQGPYSSSVRVWGGDAAAGGTGSNLMYRVRTANLKDGKLHGSVLMSR